MLHCLDPLRGMGFWPVAVRVMLAVFCGGLIGLELEYKRRPAGFRTHILICLGAAMTTISLDVLGEQDIVTNPANRCYFCKRKIFTAILEAAHRDGFSVLLDGTNASDQVSDRPGMQALAELSVLSPLRLCGLTKGEIRRRSRQAGLFTHDKPAYACLATRIPTGRAITAGDLERTEHCEVFLMGLGFSGFRIRLYGDCARVQLPQSQLPRLLEARETVLAELKKFYSGVLLDLEVRDEQ